MAVPSTQAQARVKFGAQSQDSGSGKKESPCPGFKGGRALRLNRELSNEVYLCLVYIFVKIAQKSQKILFMLLCAPI